MCWRIGFFNLEADSVPPLKTMLVSYSHHVVSSGLLMVTANRLTDIVRSYYKVLTVLITHVLLTFTRF